MRLPCTRQKTSIINAAISAATRAGRTGGRWGRSVSDEGAGGAGSRGGGLPAGLPGERGRPLLAARHAHAQRERKDLAAQEQGYRVARFARTARPQHREKRRPLRPWAVAGILPKRKQGHPQERAGRARRAETAAHRARRVPLPRGTAELPAKKKHPRRFAGRKSPTASPAEGAARPQGERRLRLLPQRRGGGFPPPDDAPSGCGGSGGTHAAGRATQRTVPPVPRRARPGKGGLKICGAIYVHSGFLRRLGVRRIASQDGPPLEIGRNIGGGRRAFASERWCGWRRIGIGRKGRGKGGRALPGQNLLALLRRRAGGQRLGRVIQGAAPYS